jgi:hypothetical protein
MNVQLILKPRFLTRTKHQSAVNPKHLEPFPPQEQFSGPVPLHRERPAAEILAERLAEADPASMSPVFIP